MPGVCTQARVEIRALNLYLDLQLIFFDLTGVNILQACKLLSVQCKIFRLYLKKSLQGTSECCWKMGSSSQVHKNCSNIIFATFCEHCASRNMYKIPAKPVMCIYTTLERPISIVGLVVNSSCCSSVYCRIRQCVSECILTFFAL